MLSDRLKKLRQEKKLTQDGLAKLTNTTKGTISNYENNYSTPSNDMLRDLAKALNTTSDYLLGITEKATLTKDEELDAIRNDPSTSIMFKNWKEMSEEERRKALEFIDFLKHERKK